MSKQPQSGMKAGYKYPVVKCAYCSEPIARNKMIQHLREKHPRKSGEAAQEIDS